VNFYLSWRALIWCRSSVSIYHCLAPTWHAPYKLTEVTLRYQVPFFNKSLFKVLESLWWNRTPMNTSVKPLPHMFDGIKVGTHCWPFHHLNVQFLQDSSGDVRYMSPGLSCMSTNSGPTPYAVTNTCCSSIDVPCSGKITMDDDKIRMAINTDATPHHHRTLSVSFAFLVNIWHVLLTTVSPYMLTSITLC